MMDRIDEAAALISAAAHDIDHPGRSSAFLCNSNNFLSILYNDMCVLESHHSALTFKLTLRDEKINIFKNLDRETYKLVRSIVVDMILATEMTRHFEHLAKFVSVFGNECETEVHTDTDENHMLIRRMLIKCADVSNPARPFGYCVEWAGRWVHCIDAWMFTQIYLRISNSQNCRGIFYANRRRETIGVAHCDANVRSGYVQHFQKSNWIHWVHNSRHA